MFVQSSQPQFPDPHDKDALSPPGSSKDLSQRRFVSCSQEDKGGQRVFLAIAAPPVPLIQNNHYVKLAYLWMKYSKPLNFKSQRLPRVIILLLLRSKL